MQYSVGIRNAKLNAIEATLGSSAVLKIWSGPLPVDTSAADSGVALAILTLPSDWMAAASLGSVSKAGTWEDLAADATGTAGHFRIYGNGEIIQGSVGTVGTNMIVSSVNFSIGQPFVVTAFTIIDNNG